MIGILEYFYVYYLEMHMFVPFTFSSFRTDFITFNVRCLY